MSADDGMDGPDRPMVVNASPAGDQAGSALRDVTLIVGALPTLIAVLGTRDVKQVVDFIASAEFAPVLGLLVSLAVVAWRQWKARHNKAKLVTLANAAPDAVATVIEKGAPK